jgi:Pyridoxamine 5'-phosphate oxidase
VNDPMTEDEERVAAARQVVDSNLYMALGTADRAGRPWVSPVYYAVADYTEFFWVSRPETEHSRNLASRPDISIVIFDSRVPIMTATGQAVYLSGVAEELTGPELDRGIAIFSARSLLHGAGEWTRDRVAPPSHLRLYRATVSASYLLGPGDRRLPVSIHAREGNL